MANWNESFRKSNKFKVINGYIEYYTMENNTPGNILGGYAGRLESGTEIIVYYDVTRDAMRITDCKAKPSAVGKYIKTPFTPSGNMGLSVVKNTSTESKTTTDDKTKTTVPQNAKSDGSTSGSSNILSEVLNIDDAFINKVYSKSYTNSDEYFSKLKEGLQVKDLRGILGMPYQFLPTADPRIDGSDGVGKEEEFGRVYSEKIIKHIPLLLMTPGIPQFMASFTQEQKNTVIGKLIGMATDTLEEIFKEDRVGKYYSLKYAYTDYFYYVNAMLRSAAYFLEIQNETIDGKKIGNLNWLYHTSSMGSDIFSHGNLANFLGPYAGSIAFYVDAGTTVDDSFGNGTTESQLASSLNSLSDQGRELNFLIGNVGAQAGLRLNALTGSGELDSQIGDITGTVDRLLGNNNIFSSILGKATTILAGGRLLFPEIWSDSSFSRSYSCSMKLVSPSGDKLSVFLNILVPIYHLLGFTLPRESTGQAYFSPFLVRAHYKGAFNVDMGIITGLSLTKGDEGEWTLDGLPTVANISFEIKDLYDGLYMSKQNSLIGYQGIMSNIQELDYIANSCGVNVNDQEVMRMARMYTALGFTKMTDKVTIGIFGEVTQYFNQKMNNIFGVF